MSKVDGNTVIGLARTPGPVEDKLRSDKITNVKILQADMSSHQTLKAAATEVSAITNGAVDYLIINGVFSDPQTTNIAPTGFIGKEEALRDDMVSSLEVNVLGTAFSINAFLPLIEKGTAKKIIAISTGLADPESALELGLSQFVTYSTIKAALNMLVVKYALELKKDGITVLALSPGLVNTQEKPRKASFLIHSISRAPLTVLCSNSTGNTRFHGDVASHAEGVSQLPGPYLTRGECHGDDESGAWCWHRSDGSVPVTLGQ